MYKARYIENIVLKTQKTFKILYLGGPRQVGKTTMLLMAKKIKMNYVTFDDLELRKLAREDPVLFLQRFPAPLLIDEVQYAPEIFPALKMIVDKSPKNGQYWLTGSQQFSILKDVQESLAGRVGILYLLGFSWAEERGIPKMKNFLPSGLRQMKGDTNITFRSVFERILRGSFPILTQENPPDPEIFYNSYLQTYIDRDLRDIFGIAKISTFHKFLELCAARTGQILNYANLARDAGISVNAAHEWIGILESTMQIFLLRPFYGNISNRIIKAPKIYFLDTGLAAFLTKWKTPETLVSGAMSGAFFETFIISELFKSYLHRGKNPPLYYFRDKQGHEVDILIEENGKLYPVEIKMAAKIHKSDLAGLHYLQKKKLVQEGAVITLSNKAYPVDRINSTFPAGMIQ